jgi:hypothetical protein
VKSPFRAAFFLVLGAAAARGETKPAFYVPQPAFADLSVLAGKKPGEPLSYDDLERIRKGEFTEEQLRSATGGL